MADSPFKSGDVVELNSGSVKLTVLWNDLSNQAARVCWFDTAKGSFSVEDIVWTALKKVEEAGY